MTVAFALFSGFVLFIINISIHNWFPVAETVNITGIQLLGKQLKGNKGGQKSSETQFCSSSFPNRVRLKILVHMISVYPWLIMYISR